MPQRRAIIGPSSGLHARPAVLVTQAVVMSGHPVSIGRPGDAAVDAASILSLMSLGLQKGEEVVLASECSDADVVLDDLVDLIETDLDSESTAS